MRNNDVEIRVPFEHVFDASATFALFIDRLHEPRIQVACHLGTMRIAAEDEALDARAPQYGKPAADRGEEPGRVKVRVNVDHKTIP